MTKKTFASSLVFLAAALAAGGAQAQPVRPNILFFFDTSGSMLSGQNCPSGATGDRCDGSSLCNNRGQGSRLFRLKQAIRETLTEVGADEGNFGLARFPQVVTPGTNRGCHRGHYLNSVTSGSGAGCKTSSSNESADGSWFTPTIAQEVVAVPVTSVFPPSSSHYDPQAGNIPQVHLWLDDVETSNGTQITQPELRSGGGLTPLGNSMFYTRLYFEKYVKPNDPKTGCRQNIVILATDGDETCNSDAVQRAAELFASGVKLYVVVQTGEDGQNHNDMARAGGTQGSIQVDFTNPTATKAVLLNIIAESVPPSEICNGRDDNCNNQVDEAPLPEVGDQCLCAGLTEAQVGKGACRRGAKVCQGAAGISCQGCVLPKAELCNDIDDDCDGEVDEDFKVPGRDLGKSCDNGLLGACRRQGTNVCRPDGSGVFCDAPANVPGTQEICNAADDDCDGRIDNGPLPGENEVCGADLGACGSGRTRCENGKFVCVGQQTMGTKEVCNGLDDDCNGLIDDNIDGVGMPCACAGFSLQTLMTPECKPGMLVCKGREPLDCEGCVLPREEICDGKDNNCDGTVDLNAPCGAGRICLSAKCEIPCRSDEFPCPTGFVCDRTVTPAVCRSTKCAAVQCQPGSQCDEGTGVCKDLCADVQCVAPKRCQAGRCVDCYTLGCEGGQLCRDGVCQPNPCAGKDCGPGQFCDERGECVGLCIPTCGSGQRCVRGSCQGDLCRDIICGASQVCDPATGQCSVDQCKTSSRPCPGQRCVPLTGQCQDDPCTVISCPGPCGRCQVAADGMAFCSSDPACNATNPTTLVATHGGGCTCRVAGAPAESGGMALTLLLAGLALVLRRRR